MVFRARAGRRAAPPRSGPVAVGFLLSALVVPGALEFATAVSVVPQRGRASPGAQPCPVLLGSSP